MQELSDFVTDELTGKLEGISGVAGVTVSGAATRQMHIVLDQEKLNAVSARLADAVSAQMDAAEGQLTSAQAQITSAQQAIDNALSAALTGADEAAAAVNQAIGSITQARDDAQTAIRNQRRLLEIDASLARLELLRQKEQAGIITDSEREELASLAAQEPALRAERDALKAAGGDSADKAAEALKQQRRRACRAGPTGAAEKAAGSGLCHRAGRGAGPDAAHRGEPAAADKPHRQPARLGQEPDRREPGLSRRRARAGRGADRPRRDALRLDRLRHSDGAELLHARRLHQ